jgi:hypothetical protein
MVMRRNLSNITAVASLVICLATAGIWVRSCFVSDRIGRVHHTPGINEDHHVYLRADHGVLTLSWGGDPPENFSHIEWTYYGFDPTPRNRAYQGDAPAAMRVLGIGWENTRTLMTGESHSEFCMSMMTIMAVAVLPAAAIALRSALRPRGADVCLACGYDLRATPERCPECGLARRPAAA